MNTPEIIRHPDAGTLAADVAERLLALIEDVQAAGGSGSDAATDEDSVHIALTGGTIADEIHREVARRAADSAVDWRRVDLWWGDERFVAEDSDDRNAKQARESWLDKVPLDEENVHEMPAAGGGLSVDEAAAAYAAEVRAEGAGRFDLVMLGLGPDGHVASLFPGFAQLDIDDQIAVGVVDSPKPPPERVSLTFSALNRTDQVWFVVSGAEKADAVRRGLAASGDVGETPARGITDGAHLWFLDEAAASELD